MSEGLRVCEEIARFTLGDKDAAAKLKSLRHDVNRVRHYYGISVLAHRKSSADIGRPASYDIKSGGGIIGICGAAFGRSQEAARVLEEFSSRDSAEIGALMKSIRFALYGLEKEVILKLERSFRILPREFGLYLIMTEPAAGYERLAEAAVKRGVKIIQLRDKLMEGKKLLETAKNVRRITKGSGTLLIVNDRPDIAILSDADGVHLGQTDMGVRDARYLKPGMIIGKSTHSIKQAESACRERPDYIGIGPFYPTNSKKIPDKVLGRESAGKMLDKSSLPSVAIGGIKPENLPEVISAGFVNFAVLSYICESKKPELRIKELQKIYRSVR